MEFENDIKDLAADSWSGMVDKKFLKSLKKDEVKRQDVIYGKLCCDSVGSDRLLSGPDMEIRVFSLHRAVPDGGSPCEDSEDYVGSVSQRPSEGVAA